MQVNSGAQKKAGRIARNVILEPISHNSSVEMLHPGSYRRQTSN